MPPDHSPPPRLLPEPRPVPPTLIFAGVLGVLEGLGILVVTGWLVVGIVLERPAEAVTAWGAAGLLGLFGVGVVFAGRGVLRAARWSRAPVAVTQLLLLAISVQLPWVAAVSALVVLAVVTGVLLFLPPSTAAFVDVEDPKSVDAPTPDAPTPAVTNVVGKTPGSKTPGSKAPGSKAPGSKAKERRR